MDASTVKTEPTTPNIDKDINKALRFSKQLKEMMAANRVHAKEVGKALGLGPYPIGTWVRGTSMPSISQARLLDKFFGSSLADDYKDMLKPDKTPKANQAEPGSTPKQVVKEFEETRSQAANKVSEALTEPFDEGLQVPVDTFSDNHLALIILAKILECLQVVLQSGTDVRS